jgi:hypothetical protein
MFTDKPQLKQCSSISFDIFNFKLKGSLQPETLSILAQNSESRSSAQPTELRRTA